MDMLERNINQTSELNRLREKLITSRIFEHSDLEVVSLGGSYASESSGKLSDIDITTLMNPKNPKKVDIGSMIQLGLQIRNFSFKETGGNTCPIIISTIRLEEAQVAMAELLNPGKTIIPIHWLHYPSAEFAAINEPPKLIEGLFKGIPITGNAEASLKTIQNTNKEDFQSLAGLDWLTDSFRVLITNMNNGQFPVFKQTDAFLKKLALHNLEYFWKWNIVQKIINDKTEESPDNWNSMEKYFQVVPTDIWMIANEVRVIRHRGEWASVDDIINLHTKTFDIISEIQK